MKLETAKRRIPDLKISIEHTLERIEEIKRNDKGERESIVENQIIAHEAFLDSLRKQLAEAEATLASGKDGKHWSL